MIAAIQLQKIKIDGGTQPRAFIDQAVVDEYAERMKAGDEFPPIELFFDGVHHWLVDGFHRYHAAVKSGAKIISCRVKNGTIREAVLYSLSVNRQHGLRRSNADKHRAVQIALDDPEWAAKSDRWIAETCFVGRELVAELRKTTGRSDSCDTPRTGRDGKVRKLPRPPSVEQPGAAGTTGQTADVLTVPPCPNCGSTDRDDDGDCAKCFEPAPDGKPAAPPTLKSALRIHREKEQAIDREPVCDAISEAPTSEVATDAQPQLAELYESLKLIAKVIGVTLASEDKLIEAADREHWTSHTITKVQSTVSAIAHDFNRVDALLRKVKA